MTDIVAYLSKNHIEVMNLKDGAVATGTGAFTTARLLVGDFKVAEDLLAKLVKEVQGSSYFSARPRLLVQPLEMTEGGLSPVEERVFLELGGGAGARHVTLHIGPKLERQTALAAIDARR